jgi:hypothetical protein
MPNLYQLWTKDERENNWITMQDNEYGAPSIFRSYIPQFCVQCGQIDKKAVFERKAELEAGPQLRVKTGREFAQSADGFSLIKTRILKLLKRHRVAGYVSREIPETEWHALRITKQVPVQKFTPNFDGPACKACGYRPFYGIVEAASQIAPPDDDNTFFTPALERPQSQDVFLTEKVAQMLKANRAHGAEFSRLLDDNEYKLLRADGPQAARTLRGRTINL